METVSKKHLKCRVCDSENLSEYLDLGMIPLANNLCETKDDALNAERFPLKVMLCENCGLSQLSEVVDPSVLFSYYTYRSSVNKGYVDHCHDMAIDLMLKYKLTNETFHIDIAGNDGALLDEFRKVLGHEVLNIDPAENLCKIAEEKGIPSMDRFWNLDTAWILTEQADLITATNVFAHLDDVTEFLEACKLALKPNGILVIENPYWPYTMSGNQFDQVYFEHMSYWSASPMKVLCEKVGIFLNHVSFHSIHGGSARYEIGKVDKSAYHVDRFDRSYFFNWGKSIESIRNEITEGVRSLKGSVVAFAASAKGNTLLNYCGLDHNDIEFICDETPEKIGKFSPGTGILIVGLDAIIQKQPDYILILSWNFEAEIIEKLRPLCPNSKFVVPIPRIKII